VVEVLLFCFEISDNFFVVLERSRPGCPIQSLEPPRVQHLFLFKDGGDGGPHRNIMTVHSPPSTRLGIKAKWLKRGYLFNLEVPGSKPGYAFLNSLRRFSLCDIGEKATCCLVSKRKGSPDM